MAFNTSKNGELKPPTVVCPIGQKFGIVVAGYFRISFTDRHRLLSFPFLPSDPHSNESLVSLGHLWAMARAKIHRTSEQKRQANREKSARSYEK
jgi:hypothetical protein